MHSWKSLEKNPYLLPTPLLTFSVFLGLWQHKSKLCPPLPSYYLSLPGGSEVKASVLQCRRPGFDPWVGKIPWRRKCNPLQYSCLENPMEGGAWWATVHGVAKSQSQLSDFTFTFLSIFLSPCVSLSRSSPFLTKMSLDLGRTLNPGWFHLEIFNWLHLWIVC